MSIKTDPALYKSEFVRNPLDRYWTETPVTRALVRRLPEGVRTIWDPAAGRGDLLQVFIDAGFDAVGSDLDPSEFVAPCPISQMDFLKKHMAAAPLAELGVNMMATNPPFGDKAEAFVRQALTYTNIRIFAFLMRSEWKHAKGRMDLFTEQPFSKEIVLTWRPRWDWWFRDKPEASPRHNYSWYIWDREDPHLPTEWATREN